MKSIRARLIAVLVSFVLATLASWGITDLGPDVHSTLEQWLSRTFDLVLFLGYAVVHPWLQTHWNPTGAFTDEAARKLEGAAHLKVDTPTIAST